MKFSCTQENLHNGLSIVSNIASKSTTLPILSNVLFKVNDGKIDLSVTNLEIGINYLIRGKVEEEGSFTIPAKILADYIGLLPRERIDMELKDNALSIASSHSKTKIKGSDPSEFPIIPSVKGDNPYHCDKELFTLALSQVIFAVSTNETRPEISGVLFSFEPGKSILTLAATDSYRLGEKRVPLSNEQSSGEEIQVIVPSRTLTELLRILQNVKKSSVLEETPSEDLLTISISENQILFHFDNFDLVSRLIEGRYPDYRQLVPAQFSSRVVVNTENLIKAVKTSSLFARAGIYDVILDCKKAGVFVSSANSQLGENISEIEATLDGNENRLVVNYRYLLDGLSNLHTPELVFESNDSVTPCILQPVLKSVEDTRDYLYLIMPIRQ